MCSNLFKLDETNKLLGLDVYQSAHFTALNAAGTVLSHTVPHALSGDVNIPKQCWAMIGNWINEGVD